MKFPIFVALATEENPYNYLNPGGIAFNLTVLLVGLLLGGLLAAIVTVFYQRVVSSFFRALRKSEANSPETAKTLAEIGVKPILGMKRALLSRTSLVRKLVSVVLPDGRVIPPLHSLDDDLAAGEAEKSAIHAEMTPAERRAAVAARYRRPGETTPEESTAEAAENGEISTKNGTTGGESAAPACPVCFDVSTAAYVLDDLHRRRAEVRFDKTGNDLRFLIPAIAAFVALAALLPVYLPYFASILDGLLTSMLGGS